MSKIEVGDRVSVYFVSHHEFPAIHRGTIFKIKDNLAWVSPLISPFHLNQCRKLIKKKHVYAVGERVNFKDDCFGWMNAKIKCLMPIHYDERVTLQLCDVDWNMIGMAQTSFDKLRPIKK